MQPSERREKIVALLGRTGEMAVEALAEALDVSRETVRRDLTRLDAAGRLRKFHGGARPMTVPAASLEKEGPFAQRLAQNAEAKRKLARAACRLFKPGDSLFIDTGSTTVALAEALAGLDGLVVVTNSPRIAATLAVNPSHTLFLIGGAYSADAGESLGPLALEQVGKFRARHAVLTAGALDGSSVMDFDLQEAEMAKAMIERADLVTVLADHSKFDRRAVFEVAPLSRVDTLVTDAHPSEAMTRALTAANVRILTP
ncbi:MULTISPECIES: DeoR/GlpR family DNA-binding transcription regulator [Alphaproteobacteria]|uniref:DeoR family transcriptional regulator n=2 Tax=Alphaproteobacteria TaxID=28211 RepID=A0A512HQ75_9HYPH|nr:MULTISPECIES: DeoR/GlpR family DNA-binding transcription regulator [Alphaproteobacteria]GEO87611.1 DeoR family transcriptional regulator [Ciceribacter naphthalenivorans]GLR23688.1 DeoR family transcriptional regulator [Ciceribacter naphthalenivorans]GLT06544.1 DeoR family transcriptional regulator [Sphingomonas psychrolutea]